MKREELKELLRNAIYEKRQRSPKHRKVSSDPTKQKKAKWQQSLGKLDIRRDAENFRQYALDKMKSSAEAGDEKGFERAVQYSREAGDEMRSLGNPQTTKRRGRKISKTPGDSGSVRQSPSAGPAGTIAKSKDPTDLAIRTGNTGHANIPPQVLQAASKAADGKVELGRYYGAPGSDPTANNAEKRKYFGRTQGGQWIPAETDPNAKAQLELYNKLMEIRAAKYKSGDKEMVKEMIREIVKSCS
jgi:hypothetical protein